MRRPCYDISLGCIMLAIKCSFAYYQIYFCLLSNTALLAIKYIFIIKKQVKHIIKCGRTIYFT